MPRSVCWFISSSLYCKSVLRVGVFTDGDTAMARELEDIQEY